MTQICRCGHGATFHRMNGSCFADDCDCTVFSPARQGVGIRFVKEFDIETDRPGVQHGDLEKAAELVQNFTSGVVCEMAAKGFPAPNAELDRLIRQGAQAIQAGLNLQIRENRRLRKKRPLSVLSDAEREIAHCVAMALKQAGTAQERL